jgi:hypothetical protein
MMLFMVPPWSRGGRSTLTPVFDGPDGLEVRRAERSNFAKSVMAFMSEKIGM